MTAAAKMDAIDDVVIDESGVFKYVLISLKIGDLEKKIVRGFAWAEYHADIFEKEEQSLLALGFKLKCLGGGRIRHDASEILVYGYSVGYGKADHTVAVKLLEKKFTNKKVDFSNDGY